MRIFYFSLFFFFLNVNIQAQALTLTYPGEAVLLDFESYDGSGFNHPASTTQLDSENWAFTGWSDGDLDFLGTATGADHTGISDGGEIGAGMYLFLDPVSGDHKLWIQPTANEFTPGTLSYRLQNETGQTLYAIHLEFDLTVLNDQERSNSWSTAFSTDNENFNTLENLDYFSPEAMDGLYSTNHFTADLINVNILPDGYVYFRFTSDDFSGIGSRDEFGLDNISVTGSLAPDEPTINLLTNNLSVDESAGSINLPLTITQAADCTLDMTIDNLSTADSSDFSIPESISFTVAGGLQNELPVSIFNDSTDEPNESIILHISSTDCAVGPADSVTLTLIDDDAPAGATYHPIAEVTGEDAEGVALSIDELVELHGVVYGVNLRPTGLEFTLIDDTGGIGVYIISGNLGYTVTEGDAIEVIGNISQFAGLTLIIPSSILLVSSGQALDAPQVVSTLSENTESQLIKLENVQLVDPSQWNPVGSGFNVDVTNGIFTYSVRIDQDTDLYNSPAPEGVLNISGLGSQFDTATPFTEGYQIVPRYTADIESLNISVVNFQNPELSIDEDDSFASLPMIITINNAADCTIAIVNSASSTASSGDFSLSPSTLHFTAGGSMSMTSTFTLINDDIAEGDESAIFTLNVISGDCVIGNSSQMTITILDDEEIIVTTLPIADASANGPDLTPLHLGETVTISGIVYGINMSTTGLSFTIIDDTGGMGVFSGGNTFNYTVTEGDELQVTGAVSQFNGLTQILPVAIELLSTGNMLTIPGLVTTLNENTESELVRINGVWITDVSQWTGTGSGFNINLTDGTNNYTMRIDAEVDLYSMTAPNGVFDLIGIGGQFDPSAPFDQGYQIFPRYQEDIMQISGIDDMSVNITLYPVPCTDLIFISGETTISSIEIFDMSGKIAFSNSYPIEGKIDVSMLPSGLYVVKMDTEEGTAIKKLYKK